MTSQPFASDHEAWPQRAVQKPQCKRPCPRHIAQLAAGQAVVRKSWSCGRALRGWYVEVAWTARAAEVRPTPKTENSNTNTTSERSSGVRASHTAAALDSFFTSHFHHTPHQSVTSVHVLNLAFASVFCGSRTSVIPLVLLPQKTDANATPQASRSGGGRRLMLVSNVATVRGTFYALFLQTLATSGQKPPLRAHRKIHPAAQRQHSHNWHGVASRRTARL